jgi:hypothetical protein
VTKIVQTMLAVLAGVLMGAVLACTFGQAETGITGARVAAGMVDLPGMNEQAIESYLGTVEQRLAELKALRVEAGAPVDDGLGWRDWIYLLTGSGAVGTAGAALLNRRLATSRNRSRVDQLAPMLDVLEDLVAQAGTTAPKPERERLASKVGEARSRLRAPGRKAAA